MPDMATRIVKIKDGDVIALINEKDFDKALHGAPDKDEAAAFVAARAANGKLLRLVHARQIVSRRLVPLGLTEDESNAIVKAMVPDAEL